jgi:bifunctional non-homologous end joining protein LigD
VQWVEPRLVGQVRFTEWTADGRVRHPSFQGLREDKPARRVVRERPRPDAGGGRAVAKASRTKAATAAKRGGDGGSDHLPVIARLVC